ncbi:glycosyltransferase family 4 protein [Candidatus Parcubacteria bacterium]|nr:glycosyltransferase family 4 protein [Candidatus Parcubacteria bacterium]
MKICHVVSADMTVEFLLKGQLGFLMDQGYEVSVVCPEGKWTEGIDTRLGVKIIPITRRLSPFSDIVSLTRLFFYFKKEKFDLVHTHAPKPGLLGQLAAKMAGVPRIVNTVHGLYFTQDSSFIKKNFFVAMERTAASCSSLIFSQNREDMEVMIKNRVAPSQKIKYLGNGVDIGKFSPERFSREDISRKKQGLGISGSGSIIGIVGRLVREKGYLELFEAMQFVAKNHPDTKLLVIGPEEPGKKDAIRQGIVKKYNLQGKVIFLGRRSDVDQLYPLMDIFVLPSWREGFPRSVLEAMACQRAIIATDIRGCREEIENGESGILVPARNAKALGEAIVFMLEHKDQAQEMAKNANIRAQREFDERLVFKRILEGYESLIRAEK